MQSTTTGSGTSLEDEPKTESQMRVRAARATEAAMRHGVGDEPLRFDMRVMDTALEALEQVSRGVAAGNHLPDESDVERLLAFLRHAMHDSLTARSCALLGPESVGRGESFLRILFETLPALQSDAGARRQFFHAARGFVAIQRGQLGTLRAALGSPAVDEAAVDEAAVDEARLQDQLRRPHLAAELCNGLEIALHLLGRRAHSMFPDEPPGAPPPRTSPAAPKT